MKRSGTTKGLKHHAFVLTIRSRLAALTLSVFTALTLPASGADSPATVTPDQLALTALASDGTNLVLTAEVPAGLAQVVLEMQPVLGGSWVEADTQEVPAAGGEVVFTIPKPATSSAFFRLKAWETLTAPPLVSTTVPYVTTPSLGTNLAENGDAVFHFTGRVDGSDRILITRAGAFWNHVNWGWPEGAVKVNGTQWNPAEKNYLTTIGNALFLPRQFSLDDVQLETIQGRDIIALERTNHALLAYLDDTPGGADTYDFKIRFHPAKRQAPEPPASPMATLKIAGYIDGSDRIKFTAAEAVWEHKMWGYPRRVTLNGLPWNPRLESERKNAGTNRFLPDGIDFSTAQIVRRKGRDLATMWSDKDALWVQFADNPGGADDYELEISFGR